MARNISGLRRGGPGRPKGQPNRATVEIRDWARSILEDQAVRSRTLSLAREGRLAPGVLVELLHYAYSKPKDTTGSHVEINRLILNCVQMEYRSIANA